MSSFASGKDVDADRSMCLCLDPRIALTDWCGLRPEVVSCQHAED
jgi:hypothetical protein